MKVAWVEERSCGWCSRTCEGKLRLGNGARNSTYRPGLIRSDVAVRWYLPFTSLLTIGGDHAAKDEPSALKQEPAQSRKKSWTRHPTLACTRCIEAQLPPSACFADLSFGFLLLPATCHSTCSKDPANPEWPLALAAACNDTQCISMAAPFSVFQ